MLARQIWDGKGSKGPELCSLLSTLPSWSVLSQGSAGETKHLCSSLAYCCLKEQLLASLLLCRDTWRCASKILRHTSSALLHCLMNVQLIVYQIILFIHSTLISVVSMRLVSLPGKAEKTQRGKEPRSRGAVAEQDFQLHLKGSFLCTLLSTNQQD